MPGGMETEEEALNLEIRPDPHRPHQRTKYAEGILALNQCTGPVNNSCTWFGVNVANLKKLKLNLFD